tara:strand:- start:970 stop:1899 length:930 start_codon:yes stop_codon:yes gene_type:complete
MQSNTKYQKNIKVSIIINCHNSEKYLQKTLKSVLDQTFINFEVILWDNASIDNTKNIILSFNDQRFNYHYIKNKTSIGKARKLAVAKARGDYICFLDSDDVFENDKIKKQLLFMETNNYVLSYGSYKVIDEFDNIKYSYKTKNQSGYILKELLERYEVNFQTVMFKRELVYKHEINFDEKLVYTPDYDFIMRVVSKFEIGVINDYLSRYRKYDNSLSTKSLKLIYPENKFTLDFISKDLSLLNSNNKYFNLAYKKLFYYNSLQFIYSNDYKKARIEIKKTKFIKIQYLILYILLFINIPKKYILKILKR